MLSLYLKSAGLIAPGINSWDEAVRIFKQPETYSPAAVEKKLDTLLPANERRRAARVTQLALYAAQQTGNAAELQQCLQVFSSSNGDLSTFHQIGLSLSLPGRPVSPTGFHNSVHNAPAGYWSIATQSQTPSTSLCAYDDSFSAGLLEAAVQLNASDNQQDRDCLLVCYDEIPPEPFRALLSISAEFACALRFSKSATEPDQDCLARLDIALSNETSSFSQLSNDAMEQLRQANPQAMVLPLLDAIVHQRHETIKLPYFEQSLEVQVTPLKDGV